jgi:hypothetical protein
VHQSIFTLNLGIHTGDNNPEMSTKKRKTENLSQCRGASLPKLSECAPCNVYANKAWYMFRMACVPVCTHASIRGHYCHAHARHLEPFVFGVPYMYAYKAYIIYYVHDTYRNMYIHITCTCACQHGYCYMSAAFVLGVHTSIQPRFNHSYSTSLALSCTYTCVCTYVHTKAWNFLVYEKGV